MKLLGAVLLLASLGLINTVRAETSSCQLSEAEHAAYLKMEFWTFDQKPEGWRNYESRGCERESRDLIDEYVSVHQATLEAWQKRILIWHSGQISGFLTQYSAAIERMEQTYNPDEAASATFKWNAYVSASLAFFRRDVQALKLSREQLALGTNPNNHINLRVIDSLIRCFDYGYADAYSRKCDPKETNADRIRSLAVNIDSDDDLPLGIKELLQNIGMVRIVMLGELHGTIESPHLYTQMVRAVAAPQFKTLAVVEIPPSSQASIDQYIKTGDDSVLKSDPFFTRPDQDGRSSKAMAKMLLEVGRLPGVEVFCMDVGGKNSQDRDINMAKEITAKVPGYNYVIALTGDVHSATSIGTSWDPNYRPMAYELLQRNPSWNPSNFLNIKLRYEGGHSWNCVDNKCQEQTWPIKRTDYSEALSWNRFFLLEPAPFDGYASTLFTREVHTSEPLMSAQDIFDN